jgi:hypothetical protein
MLQIRSGPEGKKFLANKIILHFTG